MTESKKHKVLIVDDSIDLLELMTEDLKEKNYDVITASNGSEAFEVLEREGLPDVILLDMNMPVMDGWTFAQKFSDRYGRACPVIIMTAEDDSRTRAMEIGADSYLGKPFDLESLHITLASILDGEEING